MVKILIERRVKKENYGKLIEFLKDLRSVALRQPGYVTGETLIKGDNPVDVLVISTWTSEDYWKAWLTKQERIELDDHINSFVEAEPKTSIYQVPEQD
jgi:heme-degrading monooxygenase HmoA